MIKIRKAKIEDAKNVIKLDKEWEKEGTSWPLEIYYKRPNIEKTIIKQIRKGICLLVEDKRKVVGYILGEIKKISVNWPSYYLKKNDKYGIIDSLYIIKDYRKKNIGKKLIKKLVKEFKKNNVRAVTLWVSSKNVWSLVNFYKRFGFEERYIEMVLNIRKKIK